MSSKPNNFPREGQHNTITKGALERLEAERPKPSQNLDYTIGGTRETHVHASIEAERNYALNAGYRRFKEISEKLQRDHVFSANHGRAKAQFNATNNQKTYADMQKEAAQKAQQKIRDRSR